jgi:hypothetical protein
MAKGAKLIIKRNKSKGYCFKAFTKKKDNEIKF